MSFYRDGVTDGTWLRAVTLKEKFGCNVIVANSVYEGKGFNLTKIQDRKEIEFLNYGILNHLLAFFRSLSFNVARIPELSQRQMGVFNTTRDQVEIVCHTSRTFWLLPRKLRKYVIHIDLCDELVGSYLSAAKSSIKRNPILSFIFIYEAFREYMFVQSLNRRDCTVSYISKPSLEICKKFVVFPNTSHAYQRIHLNVNFRDKHRFGVIGNFRTQANRSIIENFVKDKYFDGASLAVCGYVPQSLSSIIRDNPRFDVIGEFGELDELIELFDIGLCLVDLQGGFQNKILDYLTLGKIAVVSENVIESITNDFTYSVLLESPLLMSVEQFKRCSSLKEYFSDLFQKKNFEVMEKFFLHLDSGGRCNEHHLY